MRTFLILLLAAAGGAVWAQTSATTPPTKPLMTVRTSPAETTEITSDSAVFDDKPRKMVYMGHVYVSDPKVKLWCERLTVDLPPEGRPTNVVAETNVVIDFYDKGATNHITSAKAVYTFSVVNAVTNELITFTGNPLVDSPDGTISSEPLVWDRTASRFFFHHYHLKSNKALSGDSTNSPLKF